jgi:hypothetical protein
MNILRAILKRMSVIRRVSGSKANYQSVRIYLFYEKLQYFHYTFITIVNLVQSDVIRKTVYY